jgi:uncharacterized membrane protein YidH (DUF202 family)
MISDAEERTRLAWRRTTLSVTIVALLAVRLAVLDLPPAGAALFISLTAAAWLAFLANAQDRIRRLSSGTAPTISVPRSAGLILMFEILAVILVVRSG